MIVGEAPGWEEEAAGEPFVGASGKELNRMLHEAGISRSECFTTNVCRERPPANDINHFIAKAKKDITHEHTQLRNKWVKRPILEGYDLLQKEIRMVSPNIIITLGNTPLWALTGLWGITKWRGSMLRSDIAGTRILPTYHPAAILRQWDWRAIAVHDLRRAAKYRDLDYPVPKWNFIVRPSFTAAVSTLRDLLDRAASGPLELSFDLETRSGHIACAGISWSLNDAISIPFMCVENQEGYWREDEEAEIVYLLYQVLTHPNVQVVGQNLLYDSQYTYRHWCFVPRVKQDTMISHHVAFAGLPKRLDFQASMYCNQYVYWKDDGKEWNTKHVGEDALWRYNAEDCVRTQECAAVERTMIAKMGLSEVDAFQQSMFWPVLQAMNRGVKIDKEARSQMAMELTEEMSKRESFFQAVLGHPLNPRSPKQMQELFYDDLQLPRVISRKTGNPTLDDDALDRLFNKEPIIRPLIQAIREYRSLGVFLGTFVQAPLDLDGRMRCSYNICGAETYRFSSSENAFGSGTNLQNIPRGSKAKDEEDLTLPNIRRIFVPDPGCTFFDMDLDRADLQVVVWEADDTELKAMLREGVDIHTENAKLLHCERQMAKTWVHGTNYGGSPRTMAINCGLTVREAEAMQKRWFAAHPGIHSWQRRVEAHLHSKHCVENRYGYRRFYFDRVEALLPEALAWIPQSTVAITINRIWRNLYDNLPEVQVFLQVHDSLAGQFPRGFDKARIIPYTHIAIPYEDPLIIPVGIKTSDVSWGDCE
jgi:uracil-DNA glycosylase family 4